jgi:pyridoxamine 5'-phosphate oxidase
VPLSDADADAANADDDDVDGAAANTANADGAGATDPPVDVAAMRRDYARAGLDESDLAPGWLEQFTLWLRGATQAGLPEANAMVLATADASGRPSARTVLLKSIDERGFVFYTNYRSRKAADLAANAYASVVFPWHAIGRQVVVHGGVTRVDRAETDAYFATRPPSSQLGAWASPQSQVVADRASLEQAMAEVEERFAADPRVPTPPHWGGFRLEPESVEFWQGREARLHDRLRYRRVSRGVEPGASEWVVERLAP